MLAIKDAVAVITGGASGLGLALARYWIGEGGKVVIGDVSEDALAQVPAALGADAVAVHCDTTREEDNARLAEAALDTFGCINMVAPFAGIIRDGLLLATDRDTGKVKSKMSLAQFRQVVDVNLTGVFMTVRECAERMIDHNCRGLICLVSSIGSLGTAGQINYASTKAAVSVMPRVITAEFFRRGLADRIRCVAIAPGYVATPILQGMNQTALDKILKDVPIRRLIEPEEVAALAGELYRNEALGGDVFYIHGGLRLGARG